MVSVESNAWSRQPLPDENRGDIYEKRALERQERFGNIFKAENVAKSDRAVNDFRGVNKLFSKPAPQESQQPQDNIPDFRSIPLE